MKDLLRILSDVINTTDAFGHAVLAAAENMGIRIPTELQKPLKISGEMVLDENTTVDEFRLEMAKAIVYALSNNEDNGHKIIPFRTVYSRLLDADLLSSSDVLNYSLTVFLLHSLPEKQASAN